MAAATHSNNPRARAETGRVVFMSGNLRDWRRFVLRQVPGNPSDFGPIVNPHSAREAVTMKTPILRGLACTALVALLSSTVAFAKEKPPESWDGLELRKIKGLDLAYVRPNTQFPAYKSVQLEQVGVEFSKNWERDSRDFDRRPTAQDLEEIKQNL